jgi:hypothetical protein
MNKLLDFIAKNNTPLNFMCIAIMLCFMYLSLIYRIDNLEVTLGRSELYDNRNSINTYTSANGVYFHSGYYCVWTKDRDNCEVWNYDPSLPIQDCSNTTAWHEYSHMMLNKMFKSDPEHFRANYCNATII